MSESEQVKSLNTDPSTYEANMVAQVNAPHFVYKASQQQFLEAMQREGSFKVTKLSDFRAMEKHGSAIGDSRDGIHTLNVDRFKTGDTVPDEIRIGPILLTKQATNFFMDGCTVTRSASDNTYIFSVSTYQSVELLDQYEKDAGAGGPIYHGFIRIIEPLAFGAALASDLATTAQSNLNWYFHPCIYASTTSNYTEDGNVHTNVAVYKEPNYLYQAEWRYIFKLKESPTNPFFVVRSKNAASFVDRLIDVPR